MKYRAFLLILLLFFNLSVSTVQATTYIGLKRTVVGEKVGNWLGDWAYRREITINSSKVDSDLTDFATLIYLSSSSGETNVDVTSIFTEVGSDSNALAFTSSDALTRLYYEVEYWNVTSQEAYVWVKVPSVSSSSDEKIYIYYDSTKDGSAYHVAEQVWESSAVMVQHLEEFSGTIFDSTSNDNDGTNYGATYNATGQIDNALSFDGVDDYVEVPDSASLRVDTGNKFTLEVWANLESFSPPLIANFLVRKATTWNEGFGLFWDRDTDEVALRVCWDDGTRDVLRTPRDSNWTHYVGVYDGSVMYIYKNGALEGSSVRDKTMESTTGYPVYVSHSSRPIKGTVDEVHFHNRARSATEIKASYYSGIDSFVTYGSETGTLPYPENIVVTKLTENYEVRLYNGTNLVVSATVASNGNATLTLPSAYRGDTFEGTFKVYDGSGNFVFQEIFADTRGGDEYEALTETRAGLVLGMVFGGLGFILGVFALLYIRTREEEV